MAARCWLCRGPKTLNLIYPDSPPRCWRCWGVLGEVVMTISVVLWGWIILAALLTGKLRSNPEWW